MPSVSLGFLLLSGFSAHNMPLFPLQGPAQAQNLRDSLADAKSDIVVKVSSSLVVTIIHTCKTTTTKRSGVGFFLTKKKNKTKPILCFGEKVYFIFHLASFLRIFNFNFREFTVFYFVQLGHGNHDPDILPPVYTSALFCQSNMLLPFASRLVSGKDPNLLRKHVPLDSPKRAEPWAIFGKPSPAAILCCC
jgi:hypothetical protein